MLQQRYWTKSRLSECHSCLKMENAFLTQISEGICQGTMGPFEYIHGWAKAMQSVWGGLLTILTHQDMAEHELIEALLSDTVEGLPAAETAWLMQFGISGKLSLSTREQKS